MIFIILCMWDGVRYSYCRHVTSIIVMGNYKQLAAMTLKNACLVVMLGLTAAVLLGGEVQAQQPKNVLFFAIDDLRTELGAYNHGQVLSPNIDALASKSLLFERAYCQVSLCSPSRTSLLTGRRPDTNHVWQIAKDEYWRMFTNATTIPQYFKENGYISIGMGKVFHPGAPSGQDDYKYSWSPEGLPYYHAPLEKTMVLQTRLHPGGPLKDLRTTNNQTDKLLIELSVFCNNCTRIEPQVIPDRFFWQWGSTSHTYLSMLLHNTLICTHRLVRFSFLQILMLLRACQTLHGVYTAIFVSLMTQRSFFQMSQNV